MCKVSIVCKRAHVIVLKRTLIDLVDMYGYGVWYPKTEGFDLVGYTNADYVGCKAERKRTSGHCQFIGHSLVSRYSKKQACVSLSTVEVEYI